jgi:hypothetical protein
MPRYTYDVRSFNPNWVEVEGEFSPNGSSAVSSSSVKGIGFTVAYSSTGLFTVTFDEPFLELRCPWADLRLNAGGDAYAEIGIIVPASRTMQIRLWDISSAALADVAAHANNVVSFGCKLSTSKVR